jgi:hypothetical protein
MDIAMVMFVVSLLAVGGAYLWQSYLYSAQTTYQTELATREKQFNLDLIQQLQDQSAKIDLARRVLAGHIAASQVFSIIGALTAEHVRFTSLDFTAPASAGADAKITLSGYGASLSTVAFQSDVLGTLGQYGLRNIVKNPILSNPALDANGTVAFSLSASVDPSALSYEKGAAGSAGGSSAASSTLSNP